MRSLAVVCFFLSGASSLVFQVIWTRLFSLVFGTTTLAISTVLTAFMAGLALGSFVAGRMADRLGDPLKVYALAEAGIGVFALALPLVVAQFGAVNTWAYQRFADSYALLAATRFALSTAAIIVPTTLMGATLPLLARYFVRSEHEHARVGLRVGALYAINTAGAVAGTLLGGFVALPQLGMSAANTLAATINLLLAGAVAAAYLHRRRRRRRGVDDPAQDQLERELHSLTPPAPPTRIGRRARTATLIAFAISGATAMTYEVIWSRALSMIIGSSVYSFTIVLSAFLIGLAGGAALLGRLAQRSRQPLIWLAGLHLAIACAVALSYLLLDQLPKVYLFIMAGEALRVGGILKTQLLLALLLMLPATIAMGGVFPLTIRVISADVGSVGRDVGQAYAINTLGAIAGSFLAGFVIIPLLQLQPGLQLAASVSLGLTVLLTLASGGQPRTKLALVGAALALGLGWSALPKWDLYDLSIGPFRPSVAKDIISGVEPRAELVYYRDGLSTTVTVEKWSEKHFSLKNNGKVDASTGDDMPTQITVGLLPLLLHPRAPELHARVALIGLASGVTAGAILQYPVDRLDVVELEPAITAASHFFDHVNNRPLEDRRLRLISDDGRNFLAATEQQYDVIINEPSNPWITGVSNLFTLEYFQLARKRLRKRGIFCSWSQIYELGPRRIKAIYRAFARAFPYAYAFAASALSSDSLLVGSNHPLSLDIRRLRRALAIPSVKRELQRAGVRRADDLVALMLLSRDELQAFTTGAETNTDDNALVEFAAPRDLYDHGRYDYYVSKIYGRNWSYGRLEGIVSGYRNSEDYANLVYSLLRQGRLTEADEMAAHVEAKGGPQSNQVLALLNQIDPPEDTAPTDPPIDPTKPLAPPVLPPKQANEKTTKRLDRDYENIIQLRRRRDYCGAVQVIEQWPEEQADQAGNDFNLLWGYLNYRCGTFDRAANILKPLLKKKPFITQRPATQFYAGHALYAEGQYDKGLETLSAWLARTTPAQPWN